MRRWPAAELLLLALAVGCGSAASGGEPGAAADDGGGSGDGASPSEEGGTARGADGGAGAKAGDGADANGGSFDGGAASACADFGAATCGRLEACAPFFLQLAYGDEATCAARYAAACAPAFGAGGTTASAAQLEACAQAVAAESCGEALDNAQPAACDLTGTLAMGAVAGSGLQCQTGYCPPISGSACCQCTARAGAGSACTVDADCTAGLLCAQGVCAAPGGAGATCGASQPCALTLGCIGGTCRTPGGAGAPCQDTFGCDLEHGFYCDAQTMKCAAAQLAGGGAPCGTVSGTFVACVAGGECVNGTCVAAAADGAACAQGGAPCLQPAQCVHGKCMLPSPGACH